MNKFDNCKIWIGNNPELCRKIQEKLFELGYNWGRFGDDQNIKSYNINYLIIYEDGSLFKSSFKRAEFALHNYKEIFPSDLGIIEDVKFEEGKYFIN